MSINLHVVYKNDEKEVYKPIISQGMSSEYAEYWEPIVTRLNLEWVWLVNSAGLPLLSHLDQMDEIGDDFRKLQGGVLEIAQISETHKTHLLECIQFIILVIDEIQADPTRFLHVYLG